MQHYLYRANFRQMKYIPNQLTTERGLRIAHGVVAKNATKSWVSWSFPSLYPAEESLEGEINPDGDVLQHLTVNEPERRAFLFQANEIRLLVIQRQRYLACVIRILTFCKEIVIQPATLVKQSTQLGGLLTSWRKPLEKSFAHYCIIELHYRTKPPFSSL